MQEMTLLRNKVTDAEIADVLSKQTGIGIYKMLEAEKEKFLKWKVSYISVIGQAEGTK